MHGIAFVVVGRFRLEAYALFRIPSCAHGCRRPAHARTAACLHVQTFPLPPCKPVTTHSFTRQQFVHAQNVSRK
jgi:hypothetical protein